MKNIYTFDDLFQLIHDSFENESARPVRPAPVSPEPTSRTENLASIYDEDSLNKAIEIIENEQKDADTEYNRLKNQRLANIEKLRNKLKEEQSKSKLIRKGSDVAITLPRINAVHLLEQLTNLINSSNSDYLTINIPNVQ